MGITLEIRGLPDAYVFFEADDQPHSRHSVAFAPQSLPFPAQRGRPPGRAPTLVSSAHQQWAFLDTFLATWRDYLNMYFKLRLFPTSFATYVGQNQCKHTYFTVSRHFSRHMSGKFIQRAYILSPLTPPRFSAYQVPPNASSAFLLFCLSDRTVWQIEPSSHCHLMSLCSQAQ